METVKKTNNTTNREIVIERLLNAPRELVFETWTNPKHIDNWWGPNGFINKTESMDVKPGGKWKYTMKSSDGTIFPNLISYIKVVKPELLEYWHGSDENNPDEFHVTVTFEDANGKTKLTMRSLFKTAAERRRVVEEYGAIEGGNQTINKLSDYVEKMKE